MIVVCETLFRARYGRAETLLDEQIFEFRSENFSESFHKRLFAGLGNREVQRVAEKSEQPGNEKKFGPAVSRKQVRFEKKTIRSFDLNSLKIRFEAANFAAAFLSVQLQLRKELITNQLSLLKVTKLLTKWLSRMIGQIFNEF
jgi:hypothetical protein